MYHVCWRKQPTAPALRTISVNPYSSWATEQSLERPSIFPMVETSASVNAEIWVTDKGVCSVGFPSYALVLAVCVWILSIYVLVSVTLYCRCFEKLCGILKLHCVAPNPEDSTLLILVALFSPSKSRANTSPLLVEPACIVVICLCRSALISLFVLQDRT